MMGILVILLLTVMQGMAGIGVLALLKIKVKPAFVLSLSLLLGVAIFSAVPFIIQLLYIPVTTLTIFTALLVTCLLLHIKWKQSVAYLKQVLAAATFHIKLHEIPALALVVVLLSLSVWRCYYQPPTSRDLTSGPEVIAEYAVKEKTMINSVFTVNLETTNNQFKSPFIISLQVIYKLAGFPFGQLWLSTVVIGFIVFLYHALSITLHRLLAGILVVFFLAIPEMYAYSFMALYDYSNAVFFFLGIYFLFEFLKYRHFNSMLFAGLLMGIATYIRSETLVLTVFMLPAIVWNAFKDKTPVRQVIKAGSFFLLPTIVVYLISVSVYINHYLPVKYDVEGLINKDLLNLAPLYKRFIEMNTGLVFNAEGITHYSYFIFIFLAMLAAGLMMNDLSRAVARYWLYSILIVYLGLAFLGYLLPLLDLYNSTKRGLFKMFPLMLLYMGNNGFLIALSERIKRWELKP
jgi:hypothetical protein